MRFAFLFCLCHFYLLLGCYEIFTSATAVEDSWVYTADVNQFQTKARNMGPENNMWSWLHNRTLVFHYEIERMLIQTMDLILKGDLSDFPEYMGSS